MALSPEEIAAILGGTRRATPEQTEQTEAAQAGFGTSPQGVAAWRAWKIQNNAAELSRLEAQLRVAQQSGDISAGNLGARYAEIQQQQRSLTENQRQFNESLWADKAKFNTTIAGRDEAGNPTLAGRQFGLDEAKFNWQQAIDSRDYKAAEFWKARSQELAQNRLSYDYTQSLLAAKKGPQDWVDYWYRSRGMTPPAGGESVPIEKAIPPWAQPFQPGTYPGSDRAAATPLAAASGLGAPPPGAGPGAAPPVVTPAAAVPARSTGVVPTAANVRPLAPLPNQARVQTPSGPAWSFQQVAERPGGTGLIPTNAQVAFVAGGGAPSGQGTTRQTDLYNVPISLSDSALARLRAQNPAWAQS